jgi:DNA modification methylase
MSPEEMKELCDSINAYGLVQPLIARRSDHRVVAGHHRLEAARLLGLDRVPVICLDLTDHQASALALALNKIAGAWDAAKLAAVLEELELLPDGEQLPTGFSLEEVDDLLSQLEREAAPSPLEKTFARAAETMQKAMERAPCRVQRGQLWLLGRHRLLCADALVPGMLDRVCEGKPVDLVVADGPYGISYVSSQPRAGRRKRGILNDDERGFEAFLERALPAVKAWMKKGATVYWFSAGGGPSAALAKALIAVDRHFTLLNTLVWDRTDLGLGTRFRRRWEAVIEGAVGRPRIWHGDASQANVLRFPRAIPAADFHPTPKPVELIAAIIRAAAPARGQVLDPFLGSGTTLLACEQTGRSCHGVEIDERYCDWTLARWESLTGKQAVEAG